MTNYEIKLVPCGLHYTEPLASWAYISADGHKRCKECYERVGSIIYCNYCYALMHYDCKWLPTIEDGVCNDCRDFD
jgi:hypothetical protein